MVFLPRREIFANLFGGRKLGRKCGDKISETYFFFANARILTVFGPFFGKPRTFPLKKHLRIPVFEKASAEAFDALMNKAMEHFLGRHLSNSLIQESIVLEFLRFESRCVRYD